MHTRVAPTQAQTAIGELPKERLSPNAAARLVVLVPDVGDAAALAGRIHSVARPWRLEVVLVGLVSRAITEPELRRRMALLVAFLQEAGTPSVTRMVRDSVCMEALQDILQAEDRLAYCVATAGASFEERWLERLTDRFQRPVHTFMDAHAPEPSKAASPWRLVSTIASVAIIVGFLWLQISLSQSTNGAATTTWLLLSVAAEFGLIWLLNVYPG